MRRRPSFCVDKDGKEVDWIVGYGPPADKHLEKIQNAIAGIDTYGALNARYAKEPANVEVLFKLAREVRRPLLDRADGQVPGALQEDRGPRSRRETGDDL